MCNLCVSRCVTVYIVGNQGGHLCRRKSLRISPYLLGIVHPTEWPQRNSQLLCSSCLRTSDQRLTTLYTSQRMDGGQESSIIKQSSTCIVILMDNLSLQFNGVSFSLLVLLLLSRALHAPLNYPTWADKSTAIALPSATCHWTGRQQQQRCLVEKESHFKCMTEVRYTFIRSNECH